MFSAYELLVHYMVYSVVVGVAFYSCAFSSVRQKCSANIRTKFSVCCKAFRKRGERRMDEETPTTQLSQRDKKKKILTADRGYKFNKNVL